jgi:hypothetical protein
METLPDRTLTVHHFTQANPIGAGDGIPALLRRVAQTLETLGAVEVVDITFRSDPSDDGDWAAMTVYYQKSEDRQRPEDPGWPEDREWGGDRGWGA